MPWPGCTRRRPSQTARFLLLQRARRQRELAPPPTHTKARRHTRRTAAGAHSKRAAVPRPEAFRQPLACADRRPDARPCDLMSGHQFACVGVWGVGGVRQARWEAEWVHLGAWSRFTRTAARASRTGTSACPCLTGRGRPALAPALGWHGGTAPPGGRHCGKGSFAGLKKSEDGLGKSVAARQIAQGGERFGVGCASLARPVAHTLPLAQRPLAPDPPHTHRKGAGGRRLGPGR